MIDARAAVGDGKGGFSIEPVVVQAPGPDEVLLELRASGVCHTDWDSLFWGRRVVLGHEGAGVVLEVGEGVTSVKAGHEWPYWQVHLRDTLRFFSALLPAG